MEQNISYAHGSSCYSPWHFNVAKELNIPLLTTSDIVPYIKVGEDIYKVVQPNNLLQITRHFRFLYDNVYNGFCTEADFKQDVEDLLNNKIIGFIFEKCENLIDFKNKLLKKKV